VGENVALTWNPDEVDETRVRTALERAQMLEVIEARPEGLQGRLGERGMTLSGGQRQRMGIARGLYAEPSVLVMDEATSALDNTTEAAVQQALDRLSEGRTTLTIAHRLSTIENADQVLVLNSGHIVERGRAPELRRAGGEFAALSARGVGH
jgi:ABC-type multidrug transport system fused ATPase/permease subunit